MIRALIFGSTGQVARELQLRMPSNFSLRALGREDADLADPAACAHIVQNADVDVVINAAAYTAVDAAESDESTAKLVNTEAPAAIANACAARNIPFIHISTDYVFDGGGSEPRSTADPTGPLGVYGQTKLDGEKAIIAANGNAVILRTSWVFSAHGNNFVKTMLRLGHQRKAISVVADQIGGPTFAGDIANAIWQIAAQMQSEDCRGIYHFSSAPTTSWAGFARAIMEMANLDCAVSDITTADWPTPAKRPLNSQLDCTTTKEKFGIEQPNWRTSLSVAIDQLSEVPRS